MVRCWVKTRSGTGWKKRSPFIILWTEQPTGALVGAGSLWPYLPELPDFWWEESIKVSPSTCCCTTWDAYGLSFTINQTRVEYCAKTIDWFSWRFFCCHWKGKTTHPSKEAQFQFQFQNQAHVWYLVPQLDSGFNPVPIPVSRFQTQFQFGFWIYLTGSRTNNSNQPNQLTYLYYSGSNFQVVDM